MFVNRIAELRLLEQRYASDQAELFVLYGRRRVGKTELLAHFCANKRHIFYVADLATESTLRAGLSAAVGAVQFGADAPAPVFLLPWPAWRRPNVSSSCWMSSLTWLQPTLRWHRSCNGYGITF
jgi:hypothetical protein